MGRDTRETAAWTRTEREVSEANQKMLLKTSLMERGEEGEESCSHFSCEVKEEGMDPTPLCTHKLQVIFDPQLIEGAMFLSSYMGLGRV